ncbi:NnrS family protein [Halomonas piscis]|uniref:NnrS family protein n=1 Tax=Halomonas piscis TaxID=3031727 RepID=A0ABY9Z298_9GAMM|nr:NnrS family protein [Halomonas piscis]WNK21269.1 NnrS family protein [Halomonas piscis]
MKETTLLRRLPLMRLAFRPFFLLGAVFSVLALLAWLAFWHGNLWLSPYGGMFWWHPHEMLFGFGSAIIVGFLLTAVQNWTGRPGLSGWPLAGLAALWLLARVLLAYGDSLPATLLITLDVAFLPLAALAMARRVVAVRMWRNLAFVPLLLALACANGFMHLGAQQGDGTLMREASHSAMLLIVLVMTLLGGRVIPFFTSRKLGIEQPVRLRPLEAASLGGVVAVLALQILAAAGLGPAHALLVPALLVAATANAWRLSRWYHVRILREPLLWGLHASYAFIPLGLFMWAVEHAGGQRIETALHALAIGGMGTMMLSMMSRVSLGHTGRIIRTLPGIGIALGLMLFAALMRSAWLWLYPQTSHWVYSLTIIAWCLSYLAFILYYVIPLTSARPDGKAG